MSGEGLQRARCTGSGALLLPGWPRSQGAWPDATLAVALLPCPPADSATASSATSPSSCSLCSMAGVEADSLGGSRAVDSPTPPATGSDSPLASLAGAEGYAVHAVVHGETIGEVGAGITPRSIAACVRPPSASLKLMAHNTHGRLPTAGAVSCQPQRGRHAGERGRRRGGGRGPRRHVARHCGPPADRLHGAHGRVSL